MERKRRTVLFTVLSEEVRNRFTTTIEKFRGLVQKNIGSACVCIFDRARDACDAALEFKSILESGRASGEDLSDWGTGIAEGEITITSHDVLGEAVNLAARLQGVAKPGEIYITEAVSLAIEGSNLPRRDVGTQQFPGMPRPVRTFLLGQAADTKTKPAAARFDFSRVEEERQELAMHQLESRAMPTRSDESIQLALAESPPVPVKLHKVPIAHKTPVSVLPRKAMMGIGALIVAGGLGAGVYWFSKLLRPPDDRAKAQIIQKGVANSDVLQAMNTRRATPNPAANLATILVETQPRQADVYIQRKLVSHETPVKLKNVPIGTPLTVEIRKEGFEEEMQLISLQPNEEKRIIVSLTPLGPKSKRH